MHLSISSSNHVSVEVPAVSATPRAARAVSYRKWIALTTACLVLLCLSLEVATRIGFRRISRIESRIASQYRAASALRRTPGKETILFLGNSLPLEGVNIPQLRTTLANRTVCVPFFVEQTQYLDWYFGMRRLFQEGSKPDIAVLSMNISHLISPAIRGDYSAYYLFRAADIPTIGRATQSSMTARSGLLLSHFSLFYAGRTPLRNFLLTKVDTPYSDLLHGLSTRPARAVASEAVNEISTRRLKDIRTLSEAYGIRLVFLLPPGFGGNEASLVANGKLAGVPVLVPIHLNAFQLDKFRDGFHLNATGSAIFTQRLSEELLPYLDRKPLR